MVVNGTPQRSRSSSIGGRISFPILHQSEIIQALAGLKIDITKNELNEPHRNREKLRNIFLHLLSYCSGKQEEDFLISDKALSAWAPDNDTQLHSETQQFVEMKLFLALRHLFESCGYYEFSWRDIYGTPTPKRLQQQLSAICNLAGNFYNEQVKVFAELNEARNDLMVALDQINKDNVQLNDEYAQVELHAHSSSEEVTFIIEECRQLEADIARNNQLQSASREEAAALKKQTNDLKDELATAIWSLQEAQAEEENLRMQIVTSPDRRKASVQCVKDEVEKQKKANAKLEMQLQEVKLKIVRLEQANKESEEVEVQLDDLLEQMDKFKEMVNELELTLKQIKTNEKETSAIQYETDKAKHQHKLLQEKIISQRKHHKLQIDGAQEALDTLKASLLVVEKGRRDAMARRQESEAELRNIEASMNEQQAKTEEEITSMLAEFKEVERAFLERQDKRLALIGISNL